MPQCGSEDPNLKPWVPLLVFPSAGDIISSLAPIQAPACCSNTGTFTNSCIKPSRSSSLVSARARPDHRELSFDPLLVAWAVQPSAVLHLQITRTEEMNAKPWEDRRRPHKLCHHLKVSESRQGSSPTKPLLFPPATLKAGTRRIGSFLTQLKRARTGATG
jgi:hypothetical protein